MDFLAKPIELVDTKVENEVGGDLEFLEDEDLRDSDEGNKFQNENVYNRHLPYDVRSESQQHIMRIKALLAKSIQLDQEATYEWFIDLERFIDLYGLAFNKKDHIHFVKLHYELLVSSKDLYYIPYVARSYSRLMRKRFLITPEELELDWRPLQQAYERLLLNETETLGLRFVPEILESNLSQAIRLSRPHFSLNATQEMLEEWRPMLCPYSVAIQRAVTHMSLFLPTALPPEHHDKGFKLWFEEVIEMWLSGKVQANFELRFTLLLSRLASDCLGYIDWDPYIPRIFNHFKTSLNLNGKQQMRRVSEPLDVQPCVQWMVYMISSNNSCLDHICKLFKAIESFYHPSNSDRRWHSKLQQFLYKLPVCFVNRIYRERYKKNIWSRRVPESHRITDDQTTQFVNALMPVVLTSMFNQAAISSAALAFRDLAVLRPDLVIPPLLERLLGSYETLTEPHRLLSSINCMTSVIPAMVRPCKNFPEGPSNVVRLLLNSLPGIDSNDMRKCIAVFRFIATLAAHIRIEDFSCLVDERPDLSIEQQILCQSTSQFEDFVIQFLDKCFILIENTATASFANLDQEGHLKNGEEGIVEAAISSVTLSILAQASPQIQRAALDKIYTHITSHIFDTKTQGKAIATLCLACAKSNPEKTLAKFIPYFGRLILTLTENEEVFKETLLDEELLFSLLLMSEIVRCHSPHLLGYKDLVISVLHRALRLTSKEGYMLGCGILRHLLRALTSITCNDWRNNDKSVDECKDDAMDGGENIIEINQRSNNKLPFESWGQTTHIKELKLRWEIPTPEAREYAQDLLETFLRKAVNDLLDWSQDKIELAREEIQRCLHVVLSSLVGSASVLPTLISPAINLCPYEVPLVPMYIQNTGTGPLDFNDGTNIRTWVVESMNTVLKHIKALREDDTKSCSLICEIFGIAISYFGYNKTELRLAAQRIKSMKSGFQNKLLGSKRHLRYLLVERVAQQHRAMLHNKGQPNFTQLHLEVLTEMFELSQSHYVEVRILAQETVYLILNYFPFSENILVPMLVRELSEREIEHKKFKGLLYLLVGRRSYSSIMIDPSWARLEQLWPVLVESPHSEKPSIVRLLDRICNLIQKGFDTFELRHSFAESVKQLASAMWSNNCIDLQQYDPPNDELIKRVQKSVKERNEKHVQDYEKLVLKLVELIEDPLLHWHRKAVAFNLFSHLMRDDYPLPVPALKLCVSSLISERLAIRTKSVTLVTGQLKLHKRKHVTRKVTFSSESICTTLEPISVEVLEAKTERISLNEDATTKADDDDDDDVNSENKTNLDHQDTNQIVTVLSNSNKWIQYKLNDREYTKDEWNKMVFIDKPHIGFYEWPKQLNVYEPYDKQPKLNRPVEELNYYERAVYEPFTDPQFASKLVNYFCFEDQKGNPEQRRFDNKRPALWKALFRNYGPCILGVYDEYIKKCTIDSCEHKQKFVIEFLAGMLRGSKHWSYEMMLQLREFVLTTLDQMTISQETFNDWIGFANYVFRHRDVRRFEWLLKYLITRPTDASQSASPAITPYIQASRLSLAHYSLMQCEWRAMDHVFPLVLNNLKPQDHLLAYANVRNCLASIYSLIYMYDDAAVRSRIPGTLDNNPRRIDFIQFLLDKLVPLEKTTKLHSSSSSSSSSPKSSSTAFGGGALGDTSCGLDSVVEMANKLINDATSEAAADHGDHASSRRLTDINSVLDSFRNSPSGIGSPIQKLPPPINSPASSTSVTNDMATNGSGSFEAKDEDSEERKNAMKVMKLTSCWIIYMVFRLRSPLTADFFKLLPIISEMAREGNDPELSADSIAAVAILGNSSLMPEAVLESLKCVRKIIAHHSWHARVAAAAFIEIMVSSNLFNLVNNDEWRAEIDDIVINHLIIDERIEVRESSTLTLSGLIHCEFTKVTPSLIDEFKRRANEPLVKRKQLNGSTIIDSKSIVIRHSGILCLCACVDAYPYTVPDYLPAILTLLSDHLTDPQPISTTIKKTMSNFKRTHYDNWQSDKAKFTDDQLCILADLLVSPSYYA